MSEKKRLKTSLLERRHRRVRKKVNGTASRPRLVVHRSLQHVRAQIVNDDEGRTLVQVSSTGGGAAPSASGDESRKMSRSVAVGERIASAAKELGIQKVSFDRGGRRYHGRVKAVADAARKGGLEF